MRRTNRAIRKRRLRVGDRIRIVSVPGEGATDYCIHRDTRKAYRVLIERGRPVRVFRIDEDGLPWFRFRIRLKNGTWEHHFMCVAPGEDNWVMVKHRSAITATESTQ
jgi:hypothetical protein